MTTAQRYIFTNIKSKEYQELTLSEWLEKWITLYAAKIKRTTLESYTEAIKNHINRVLGNMKLVDLTSEIIQLFYNTLIMGIDIPSPLSAKTICNIHGVLHKSLECAIDYGYISTNPANRVRLPKKEHKIIVPLTNEQIILFLRAISASSYCNVFAFALFTGLRKSEIIGLTWDCVDFTNRTIRIDKQLVKDKGTKRYRFTATKTAKERYIIPPNFIMSMLQHIKNEQESNIYLFENTFDGRKFVFLNENGEHLTPDGIYNAYKKIMKKIGLGNFTFHDLRHTFAVLSLQSGEDIKTLQYNLGHYSVAFTLDVYGYCSDVMKLEASKKFEEYCIQNFKIE